MFLHLGADVMVLKKDIVAIMDLYARMAGTTRDFLNMARDHDFLELIADADSHRSFVITTDRVYLSPISCSTLKKRAGFSWASGG